MEGGGHRDKLLELVVKAAIDFKQGEAIFKFSSFSFSLCAHLSTFHHSFFETMTFKLQMKKLT